MAESTMKEKAGVVVYQYRDEGKPNVLVVSARKFKNQWVFPVGSVKNGESIEDAARRECQEESGYLVKIGRKLPSIQIPGNGPAKKYTFFLAKVVGEVGQWETDRERKWLPVSEVVDALPDVFQGVAQRAVDHIMK